MTEQATRERILTTSRELFMKYGIRTVCMDDIAGEMGISKKTIYQYFTDKENLVGEVIGFKINESQVQCTLDTGQALDAVHELFLAMDQVERMFRNMNPSVLPDLKKYHPVSYEKFLRFKNEFIYNVIRNNLVRGIREGLYRSGLDIEIITRFRIESMLMPLDSDFYSGYKGSLADVEKQILEHYLFGIVSLEGYKRILDYQQKNQSIKTT